MELFVTAQQLHAQSDAAVPLPREDADVASVDRRIKDVLLVDVIVAISWKNLTMKKKRSHDLIRAESANHSIFEEVVQIFQDFLEIYHFSFPKQSERVELIRTPLPSCDHVT